MKEILLLADFLEAVEKGDVGSGRPRPDVAGSQLHLGLTAQDRIARRLPEALLELPHPTLRRGELTL